MLERTWIHAFTDGRDVSPTSALRDLAELPQDRIATIAGRYYAMDRDNREERTQLALDAIVGPCTPTPSTPGYVQESYDGGVTDEFLLPVCVEGRPRLDPAEDSGIFFNFRPDRARQLAIKLLELGVDLTTMTRYRDDLDCPVAFGEQLVQQTLAEVLAHNGVRQLHCAETEKYAHVTYFFNGGREEPWEGETRILVPSPRDVPSYDHKPEMAAREVTDRFCAELADGGYGFAVVNYANPDMVGHTGSIQAVVQAVETVDECLLRVVETVENLGGACLVTADHGNAEQMLEADGVSPFTAHTTNPVPLLLTAPDERLREGGELKDLAPTALQLLGLDKPDEMTGNSLADPA
jgi:2,3-bisphosphoglycerate-independent phosphoglycerate mutase